LARKIESSHLDVVDSVVSLNGSNYFNKEVSTQHIINPHNSKAESQETQPKPHLNPLNQKLSNISPGSGASKIAQNLAIEARNKSKEPVGRRNRRPSMQKKL
jgi:hypothetical protein